MYNVLTDFHHASLLQSFILFFEKRMGGNVFRPIGLEWFENGYWKVYDHPATVAQFLGINAATPDGTPPLNTVVGKYVDGVYLCNDIDSGQTNKAITFETFMRSRFDIVIASLPYHVEPFKKLCELHPNHPKLIYQIGNTWDIGPEINVKNVMASANISYPEGVHFIKYHQEFDTNIFKPIDLTPSPWICSFVNVFNGQEHFANDWKLFLEVEQQMDDFTFKSYGGQCRDGAMGPSEKLAAAMKVSKFIWHTKAGGDGYGHIVHNAAAVGRPLITKKEYYVGKLGGDLMIDGETCIAIDGLSIPEIINKIRYYEHPDRYYDMCGNVHKLFKEIVDFDKEARELQLFMADLK